ncbi:pyridoxal phosphate-dependent aminotransferase [Chloroflexota bacterium]
MSLRPKQWITRLKTCPHGGINNAEMETLGLSPDGVLDFSVCVNPFMPPPGLKDMLGIIAFEQYPDSEATELRREISAHIGVPARNILVGSGTTELIRLIAMTYFRKGDLVLILEPTYGEYEVACRMGGTKTIKYRATEEHNFAPSIEDVSNLIRKHHPKGVFICNPNNPTGKYLSRREIETVLDTTDNSLLILDEAYIAFVEKSWNSVDLIKQDNVVILRSMTKDFGLPGLRLGYTVAHRDIIDSLRRVCPPWNVNIIAQKVGAAVLHNMEYLEQSLLQIQEAKRFLTSKLSRLGFMVLPSDANYFMVRVGNARKFRNGLIKSGILVRDGTSFGLPEYVRIAPRTMPECAKLITAIGNIA